MKEILIRILNFLILTSIAQSPSDDSKWMEKLPIGKFGVGFKLIEEWDNSRSYQPLYGDTLGRPMQIACWFPTNTLGPSMSYIEYIALSTRSENFILNDSIEEVRKNEILKAAHVDPNLILSYLKAPLLAVNKAQPLKGAFELVLLAPGSSAHWYDNVLLAERLASFGYVVMSCKSRGLKSPLMTTNWEGVESQTRDLEFMQGQASKLDFIKISKVHTVGRSWGALASLVFSVRNPNTISVSSLDGTLSYNAMLLMEDSPYPGGEYVKTPLLLEVGLKRSAGAIPVDRINYFQNVDFADVYLIEYQDMPHTAFGSYYLIHHYLSRKSLNETYKRQVVEGYISAIEHLIKFILSTSSGSQFIVESNEKYRFAEKPASQYKSADAADFSYILETKSTSEVLALIESIRYKDPEFDFTKLISPSYINSYAYRLKSLGLISDAARTLEVATSIFEKNANLFDSLGEMYFELEDWPSAIKNYKKSVDLDPTNTNAKSMIVKIEELDSKP